MGFVFWKILKYHPDFVKAIEASFHFNEAVSKILAGRFNSLEQIESNFNCCSLESPFSMLNMELAVERLKRAIFKKNVLQFMATMIATEFVQLQCCFPI